MRYYFSTIVESSFDEALEKATEELKKEGFGVLTEIDVKATLKKKLDVDFRKYKILGACNPSFAHQALQLEDKVGLLLPCNVVIQEISSTRTEVAIIDPVAGMSAVDNQELAKVASQVQPKLQRVIAALAGQVAT